MHCRLRSRQRVSPDASQRSKLPGNMQSYPPLSFLRKTAGYINFIMNFRTPFSGVIQIHKKYSIEVGEVQCEEKIYGARKLFKSNEKIKKF